uniref:Cortactin-binding protein-2 N-terminal domain-containing protein n=1 Tax=Panagrolaimus sp. ES5 TaxID=591445 RepID=A0AC34F662_9BILA
MNPTSPRVNSPSHESEKSDTDYSKEDLLKLLVYFEGELQQKETLIETLKDEKAQTLLNQAKYGKLKMGDPLMALNRDGNVMKECLDESVLNAMENLRKQHEKVIEEMEEQRSRKEAANAQTEDIMSALEDARDNLAKQIEFKQNELDITTKLLEAEKQKRKAESDRTKLMVTYLLNERKKLLLTMQQRLTNQTGSANVTADSPLVKELRKEIQYLRDERNRLNNLVQQLQTQNTALEKKLKIKEEDNAVLRQNILSKTRQQPEQSNRQVNMGGLVVANKGAIAAASRNSAMTMPVRTRLPNSSSFPSTIPGTSSSSSNSLPKTQTTNSTTTLYKKFPTISPSLGSSILPRPGGSRGVPFLGTKASNLPITRTFQNHQQRRTNMPFLGTKASNLPITRTFQNHQQRRTNSNVDAEIDQLGMVIESMSPRPHTTGSIAKRSSSLPRNSQHQIPPDGIHIINEQQHSYPHSSSSNIPIHRTNGNHHPRTIPTAMPTGKHPSRMAQPGQKQPNVTK